MADLVFFAERSCFCVRSYLWNVDGEGSRGRALIARGFDAFDVIGVRRAVLDAGVGVVCGGIDGRIDELIRGAATGGPINVIAGHRRARGRSPAYLDLIYFSRSTQADGCRGTS